jgi:hypothetical protein
MRLARDALRQRLAAAKTRESSAAEIMASLEKSVESARENLHSSREEVRVVEALLNEAEDRWVDVEIYDASSLAAEQPNNNIINSVERHTNITTNNTAMNVTTGFNPSTFNSELESFMLNQSQHSERVRCAIMDIEKNC